MGYAPREGSSIPKFFTSWIALFSLLVGLGGCATAAKDFPRPTAETAVIGQTTQEQVRQTFGAPRAERTDISSSPTERAPSGAWKATTSIHTRLWYFFRDANATPGTPRAIAERRGEFHFANDKLVSYRYSSSFNADSTIFNESLVYQLEREKTTQSEAEQLLGKPSGMGVKLASGDQAGKQHYYSHWYVEVNTTQHVIIEKCLYLFFNPNDVLVDFKLSTTREPYRPKTGPIGPIYVSVRFATTCTDATPQPS